MKMKMGYYLTVLCLLLIGPAAVNAKCKCGKPPKETLNSEKIYVQPSEIDIVNNQIYVKIEDQAVPAFVIYTDNEGIYVLAKRRQGRCPEDYWECSTCTGCTPWHTLECDWCGYD